MSNYYKECGIDKEKLRLSFREIKKNYPDLWIYLKEIVDICPPPYYECKIDESEDMVCWQGCKLCWENYLEGKSVC